MTYQYFTVERSVGGILKRSRLEFCSAPLIDMVMCLFQRLLRLCTRFRVPIFFIRLVRNPPRCCYFLLLPLYLFKMEDTGSVGDVVPTPMIGSL